MKTKNDEDDEGEEGEEEKQLSRTAGISVQYNHQLR